MAPNPRRVDERLDALYAELPTIACQGLCSDSCGPIEMSVRERRRIEEKHGPVSCGFGASCTMLDGQRRCRAYAERPLICRLWGLMESMPCHYGCKPEPGYLTDAESFLFLTKADEIGGSPSDRDQRLYRELAIQAKRMGDAGFEEYAREIAREFVIRPSLGDRERLISPPGIDNKGTGVAP